MKLKEEGRCYAYLRVGWQAHLELVRDEEGKVFHFMFYLFDIFLTQFIFILVVTIGTCLQIGPI